MADVQVLLQPHILCERWKSLRALGQIWTEAGKARRKGVQKKVAFLAALLQAGGRTWLGMAYAGVGRELARFGSTEVQEGQGS